MEISLCFNRADVWAIEQVFPIMPLHRHTEAPTRRAFLADITCDSDGKIDRFIESGGMQRTLPVHAFVENQPYYFGVFLVGAYQETLGDLHNLMGDTNVASVRILEDGSFEFAREMSGDSIATCSATSSTNRSGCWSSCAVPRRRRFARTVSRWLSARRCLSRFSASLRGYTYYED